MQVHKPCTMQYSKLIIFLGFCVLVSTITYLHYNCDANLDYFVFSEIL